MLIKRISTNKKRVYFKFIYISEQQLHAYQKLYMKNNSLGIQESEYHFNMETFLEGDIVLYVMVYFLNSKLGLFFLYIHKKQKIQSNFTILSYYKSSFLLNYFFFFFFFFF